jgi:hypothetical protein
MRQLPNSERIPASLGDDPFLHAPVHEHRDRRAQERSRVSLAQAADEEVRQTREICVVARRADGKHHRDRLGDEAARCERKRLRRRAVEPLRIIDQADERSLLGGLGEEAEGRQAHQEPIRGRPGFERERRCERVSLRFGQARKLIQHRPAELVERCERQLHLGLNAGYPGHATT